MSRPRTPTQNTEARSLVDELETLKGKFDKLSASLNASDSKTPKEQKADIAALKKLIGEKQDMFNELSSKPYGTYRDNLFQTGGNVAVEGYDAQVNQLKEDIANLIGRLQQTQKAIESKIPIIKERIFQEEKQNIQRKFQERFDKLNTDLQSVMGPSFEKILQAIKASVYNPNQENPITSLKTQFQDRSDEFTAQIKQEILNQQEVFGRRKDAIKRQFQTKYAKLIEGLSPDIIQVYTQAVSVQSDLEFNSSKTIDEQLRELSAEMRGLGTRLEEKLFSDTKEKFVRNFLAEEYQDFSAELKGMVAQSHEAFVSGINEIQFNPAESLEVQTNLLEHQVVKTFTTEVIDKLGKQIAVFNKAKEVLKKDLEAAKNLFSDSGALQSKYDAIVNAIDETRFDPKNNMDSNIKSLNESIQSLKEEFLSEFKTEITKAKASLSQNYLSHVKEKLQSGTNIPLFYQNVEKSAGDFIRAYQAPLEQEADFNLNTLPGCVERAKEIKNHLSTELKRVMILDLDLTDSNVFSIKSAMEKALEAVKPGTSSAEKIDMLRQIKNDFEKAQPEDKKFYLALFLQVAGAQRTGMPSLFTRGQTNSLSTFISSLKSEGLYQGQMKEFIDGKGMKPTIAPKSPTPGAS